MKILCLDLSSHTGWAVAEPDGELRFGTKHLPLGGDEIGPFALAFDLWLRDMIALEKPQMIVFEAPIVRAGKTSIVTARKLLGLAYHVELICRDLSIACREANLMTVKAFFAGSGRASKDDMIASAHRYGFRVQDDNAADAVGCWVYSVHTMFPQHAARFKLGALGAREVARG